MALIASVLTYLYIRKQNALSDSINRAEVPKECVKTTELQHKEAAIAKQRKNKEEAIQKRRHRMEVSSVPIEDMLVYISCLSLQF